MAQHALQALYDQTMMSERTVYASAERDDVYTRCAVIISDLW